MVCKQEKCLNCYDHFEQLRPTIKEVITSKYFLKDAPDFDANLIVDFQHEHFTSFISLKRLLRAIIHSKG